MTALPGGTVAGRRLELDPTCRIEFGAGGADRLPSLITGLGARRVFVVTDRGLGATGIVHRVSRALGAAGLEHEIFDEVAPNPDTGTVDAGAARAREFGDAVVLALGGGSALDAAKAIALLAGNPAAAASDAAELTTDGLPVVAVPTTAGTGAETNGFGVLEDTCRRRKVYLGNASVKPRIAVLDPALTLGLPAPITAATGFDALVHGIESLASRGANPVSAAYAGHAVAMVSRWLPTAYADGGDLEARAQLMLGAHLAGQALTLSGLGLVHGIGHALTAHTGTPHGIALAAVLEEVMTFSAAAAEPAYEQVAMSMRVTPAGTADGGWATAAVGAVRELAGTLGVKRRLQDLGAERALLPSIAATALADPVSANSPVLPTETELLDLLESVY
ncbi:iron-containing alcohol dehydrogenase family protein [Amycolatopsis nigrescens]|uniref:iron-containing alcohol dehydrogenase family protein n=1 Tax=Amycolatopsis nigrescens TaxID=381445 RepID=UPI000382E4A5|nr:iron-containing alcohol dehydrogenase [Amycolatopsis nigrescens]